MIQIIVAGKPSQQGSKKHVGHGVMVEMAKSLPAWRKAIVQAAVEQTANEAMVEGACRLSISFYMPRGKTVKRKRPSVPPDLDKMVRAVCDALTIANVWRDDCLVVSLHVEEYYDDAFPAGAVIDVVPL